MFEKLKKQKPKVKKKSDKANKVLEAINHLELGQVIRPTALAHKIPNFHHDTLIDMLDLHDSLKEVGFKTLRDKNNRIREIIRTDESLDLRKDVRDIKKEILELKNMIDEIKTGMKK